MDDLKSLIRKRGIIKGQLTRFITYLDKQTAETPDLIQLENRLRDIENLIHKFDELQTEIESLDENTSAQEHENERDSFENSFYKTTAHAKRILAQNDEAISVISDARISNNSNNGNNITNQVKLPTLSLPTFDGAYTQWLFFRDTFKSIIHTNENISKIEKFHYLRLSLKGDAAEVVNTLEISAANYDTAWELLLERFENKSLLINNHIKAILQLTPASKESYSNLRTIWDNALKHVRALEVLGQPVKQWDALLIAIIIEKLDTTTKREWEEKHGSETPNFDDFSTFLKSKCRLLERLQINSKVISETTTQRIRSHASTDTNVCIKCKGNHLLYNCKEFADLSLDAKWEEIKKLNVCSNCLRQFHSAKNCRSTSSCRKCQKRHHTMLHKNFYTNTNTSHNEKAHQPHKPNTPDTKQATSNLSSHNETSQILLSTALVQIQDRFGQIHECKALLDSGSQSNFMTESLCKKLQLDTTNVHFEISGINKAISSVKRKCQTRIMSRHNNFQSKIVFLVLQKITDDLPHISFNKDTLNVPQNIALADPTFDQTSQVDILIGAETFWDLLSAGQIKLGKLQPILQKTQLGWIISGPLSAQHCNTLNHFSCSFISNKDLDQNLTKFWEVEEVNPERISSPEENLCENHFISNLTRDNNGRFIVKIPMNKPTNTLGESRQMAEKRFYALERKLNREPDLKKQYCNFMQEYEDLSHMTLIPSPDLHIKHYYLPHHGVTRENSETTKLRVVFDASAATSTGVSFNDIQMTGPVIQDDLLAIILRFRKHNFVISADIEKMYRQVLVAPEQRCLQRILWRTDPTKELSTFELNTVTYGMAAASYLAIRCLCQLAEDFQDKYPKASSVIKSDFYVDDLLSGATTIKEARILSQQITEILKTGNFVLRKWRSNVQEAIETEPRDQNSKILNFGSNNNAKTLGLTWCSTDDTLRYDIEPTTNRKVTKRSILSDTAQIFDPLGLLSPCTINAKIIMQKLWQSKLAWDESIPLQLHTRWIAFRSQLDILNDISVPRHVICRKPKTIQLHGFSDASESAYGAAIYIRSTDEDGTQHVNLLCSKTRVAPLKGSTIPRLELSAALLLARLSNKVTKEMKINFDDIFYWSDSSIVLAWIHSTSSQWKVFVSNRVFEIQTSTNPQQWHHVSTKENPADLLTRGIEPATLKDNQLWWHGPKWLANPSSYWPLKADLIEEITSKNMEMERRKGTTALNVTTLDFDLFEKYSSLTKLQRVTSYCLRFKTNSQINANRRQYEALTPTELRTALHRLIKITQQHYFTEEIYDLIRNLINLIQLNSLSPFIDDEGIIRVGGRLMHSEFDAEKKHPIILPGKATFAQLLIKHEHVRLLHAGPQALLANLREKYWLIGARNSIRKTIHKCIKCFRFRKTSVQYQMSDLPKSRVSPARPFLNCGVDYAGPVLMRDRKTRNFKTIKVYICLFVCLATRAVHIELISDLSSEAFLAAFRRFIARRGKCANVFSDNGTNFVGACKELNKFIASEATLAELGQEGVTWHFIPPRAPHFGGLWEAGVKSVKYHLKRVVGNSKLTFEELTTVLTQIESCLNSRPLYPISSDPNDTTPLTPAHFIIGESLTTFPEPNLMDVRENCLTRFQRLQQILQNFWKRWSKEYISEMQVRTKWKSCHSEILKPDSLVIIKEDNAPPLQWKLGRVLELHPGSDNTTRVVTVRTSSGVFKRPVAKVCVLPLENDTD